jgi:hypothetical protein
MTDHVTHSAREITTAHKSTEATEASQKLSEEASSHQMKGGASTGSQAVRKIGTDMPHVPTSQAVRALPNVFISGHKHEHKSTVKELVAGLEAGAAGAALGSLLGATETADVLGNIYK